jgi:hypothetical protein
MRKDLSQRLLWSRLKTLRLKLRRVPSNLIREYPSDAATKLACAQPDFLKSVSSRAALNRACNAIPDQCCDQNRGVELSDESFRRGQRSRNAMDRIRVAIRHGGEGFKAEIDQAARFACGNSAARGVWKWIALGIISRSSL